MLNYYYSAELHLQHPIFERVIEEDKNKFLPKNVKLTTFTSRVYNNVEDTYRALEEDIQTRLALFHIQHSKKVLFTRVNESNPYHIYSMEELENKIDLNEEYASYIEQWDDETVLRVTLTTEQIEFDEDGNLQTIMEDNGEQFMKFFIKSYDDGFYLPPNTFLPLNYSSVVQ
jgi:hypothetical protein